MIFKLNHASSRSVHSVSVYSSRLPDSFFPCSFRERRKRKKEKNQRQCRSELEKRAEEERVDKERRNFSGGFLRRGWQETATGFSSLGNYSRLFGLAVFVSRCKCRDVCTFRLFLSLSATRASSSANVVQVFLAVVVQLLRKRNCTLFQYVNTWFFSMMSFGFDVTYRTCWIGVLSSFFWGKCKEQEKNLQRNKIYNTNFMYFARKYTVTKIWNLYGELSVGRFDHFGSSNINKN